MIQTHTVDQLDYLSVLECEVRVLHDRLQPHDTGHLHTTINVLRERINELREEIRANVQS
jgi:hypothetical protein